MSDNKSVQSNRFPEKDRGVSGLTAVAKYLDGCDEDERREVAKFLSDLITPAPQPLPPGAAGSLLRLTAPGRYQPHADMAGMGGQGPMGQPMPGMESMRPMGLDDLVGR
jgi:hypothetical protein